MGNPNATYIRYFWMIYQDLLCFGRVYIDATRNNQVAEAVGNEYVPIFVDIADFA